MSEVTIDGTGRWKKYVGQFDTISEVVDYVIAWCITKSASVDVTATVAPGLWGCPDGGVYHLVVDVANGEASHSLDWIA